jgi:hypothetical protein
MIKDILLAVMMVLPFLGSTAHAEMRGSGPFAAWVARSADGEYYLLKGFTPRRLSKADQKVVAQHLDHFILFEADPDSAWMPYTNIKNVKRLPKAELQGDPIIRVSFPESSLPYGTPMFFDMIFLRGPQKVYSPDTKYMRAAIWTSGKDVPRVVRTFSINRLWDGRFDETEVPASKPFRRSVNVLLPPGEYRLVVEGITRHYDDATGRWFDGRFLLSEPSSLVVTETKDKKRMVTSLYSWLTDGPAEERVRVARGLVELGEDTRPYALVLDDLETGVFDHSGRGQAIGFVSQRPSPDVLRALRTLILRETTDSGIENILSSIPTDNRPDRRPSKITEMLIGMMKQKRFVKASHSSLSHVRVCDCVAAWLAGTTNGSGYYAGKSIEERNETFPGIIAEARRKMKQ